MSTPGCLLYKKRGGALREQALPDVRERQADEHHPVNKSLVVKEEIILNIAMALTVNRSLLRQ